MKIDDPEIGVCVVLPTYNTIEEVVAISRRNNVTQWGLPGGKREEGETNLQAMLREAKEELGLTLQAHLLQPIYSGWCYGKDGRNFWVTTYLYEGYGERLWEQAKAMEEGFEIQRVEMLTLCQDHFSPFAPYNQRVIAAWRSFK